MQAKRLMNFTAAMTGLVLACACTTINTVGPDDQGYTWSKDNVSIYPDAWFIEYVPADEVRLRCGLEPKAIACSVRRPNAAGVLECYIYTPRSAPRWVLAHEMRHCLGWVHGLPDMNHRATVEKGGR